MVRWVAWLTLACVCAFSGLGATVAGRPWLAGVCYVLSCVCTGKFFITYAGADRG